MNTRAMRLKSFDPDSKVPVIGSLKSKAERNEGLGLRAEPLFLEREPWSIRKSFVRLA